MQAYIECHVSSNPKPYEGFAEILEFVEYVDPEVGSFRRSGATLVKRKFRRLYLNYNIFPLYVGQECQLIIVKDDGQAYLKMKVQLHEIRPGANNNYEWLLVVELP